MSSDDIVASIDPASGGKAEFFRVGQDGMAHSLGYGDAVAVLDPKRISATVADWAQRGRTSGLASLASTLSQVGTREAFERLAESARGMSSILIKLRPPLPATVRKIPPVPKNTGGRADFARARAHRSAKLRERRRALRRNRVHIRKFGPPPRMVTSLAQGHYRVEDDVLTFTPA